MKMKDHFDLPLRAHNNSHSISDARDCLALTGWSTRPASYVETIKAAAHAINCHDELVEALKELYEIFPDCEGGPMGSACMKARAAIAKAKGV